MTFGGKVLLVFDSEVVVGIVVAAVLPVVVVVVVAVLFFVDRKGNIQAQSVIFEGIVSLNSLAFLCFSLALPLSRRLSVSIFHRFFRFLPSLSLWLLHIP